MNELLRRINQRLSGRSLSERFNGFGCLEFQRSGQPHLHLLLRNDIDPDKIREVAHRVIRSAKRHGKPFLFLDEDSIDIPPVYREGGVARYVTKLYEHLENGEQMLLIEENVLYA